MSESDSAYPELVFEAPFDELDARDRGYVSHASVRVAAGATYRVYFYDPDRLSQDLEYEVSIGRMCIAEPGLIVLPEITLENMQTAVRRLYAEGYFDGLRPLEEPPP